MARGRGPLGDLRQRRLRLPCRGAHYWFDDELWTVELDGEIIDERTVLVARRGRLLARVAGWPTVSLAFAEECSERARGRAATAPGDPRLAELIGDADYHATRAAEPRHAVIAAYCAAVAAETLQPGGFEAERAWQSARLAVHLGL